MTKTTKATGHNQLEKPTSTSSKRWIYLGVAAIVLATLIAYLPAIRAGFIWDDDDNVHQNAQLKTFSGLGRIWSLRMMVKHDGQRYLGGYTQQYYPMVHSSFWLESRLWTNQNPTGFHLVNVLLHIANALLVWLICRRLGFAWGLLAALIFALHPVEVESVAWITERKNVLSGLFYLLALLSYLRFDTSRRKVFYFTALGCFILALLSKTVTCSLPVILLLILWMRHRRLPWAHSLRLIPFFIIGAALGLFTAYYELHSVGTAELELQIEFWQRLVIAGRAVFFYVSKLLWPNLIFIYPRWNPQEFSRLDLLWPAAAIVLTFGLWFARKSIGRAPLAAWAAFVVSLFPALGFFDVYYYRYSFVADHWQYLASIFLIALFVGLAHSLYKRLGSAGAKSLAFPNASVLVTAIVILGLGYLTHTQARMYDNIERLWTTTISKNSRAWLAWNNRGTLYLTRGNYKDAMRDLNKTIELNPKFAIAYTNRGGLYVDLGRYDQALRDLDKAIKLDPKDARPYINRGIAYGKKGEYDQAIRDLNQAIKLNATSAEAHYNRGLFYFSKGEHDKAIRDFEKALQLAQASGRKQLADFIQNNLERYKSKRPYPYPESSRIENPSSPQPK